MMLIILNAQTQKKYGGERCQSHQRCDMRNDEWRNFKDQKPEDGQEVLIWDGLAVHEDRWLKHLKKLAIYLYITKSHDAIPG